MKTISLNSKIIILFLVLYLITYNLFLNIGINGTYFNLFFWMFMVFISWVLLGYSKNKSITKKTSIQFVLIYCLLYFIIVYFLGIITGFNIVPYSHNFIILLKNIAIPLGLIICEELIRYMLIFKNRFSKVNVLFINILFIMISIVMVIDMYSLSSTLLIFIFIFEVVIASIYNNSLETLMSYNSGPIPCIIYRVLMELYIYIVPFVPDLGIYLGTVLNICLPASLIICLNRLCYIYKNVSKKRVIVSKMYITVPLVIVFVAMVSLVSGIFRYKIVAVASDSMKPIFERGDAIVYEKIDDCNKLNKGDVLVFKHDDIIYIHRIVDIIYKDKEYNIYTKGDNNSTNDIFITHSDDVVGVVKYEVKYIGYPTLWVTELFEKR